MHHSESNFSHRPDPPPPRSSAAKWAPWIILLLIGLLFISLGVVVICVKRGM